MGRTNIWSEGLDNDACLLKIDVANLLKIYKIVYITLLIKSKLTKIKSVLLDGLTLASQNLSSVLEFELSCSFSHDVLNIFVNFL